MSHLTTAYREAAKAAFPEEGTFDFEAEATVSESEHGAYVACWVWVDRSEVVKYPSTNA